MGWSSCSWGSWKFGSLCTFQTRIWQEWRIHPILLPESFFLLVAPGNYMISVLRWYCTLWSRALAGIFLKRFWVMSRSRSETGSQKARTPLNAEYWTERVIRSWRYYSLVQCWSQKSPVHPRWGVQFLGNSESPQHSRWGAQNLIG